MKLTPIIICVCIATVLGSTDLIDVRFSIDDGANDSKGVFVTNVNLTTYLHPKSPTLFVPDLVVSYIERSTGIKANNWGMRTGVYPLQGSSSPQNIAWIYPELKPLEV